MKIIPVLLAGGIGERFWPLSRSSRPKQLLRLTGEHTMIEETLLRVGPLCTPGVRPVIVTGAAIARQIRLALRDRSDIDWIVEPEGKNTAPAVAAAAAWICRTYGDAIMVVLSADHAISPRAAFLQAVRQAAVIARTRQSLVVFGIRPDRPETGYGYIHMGDALPGTYRLPSARVRAFVEKPDLQTAQRYCRSGRYLWNSGMFVWKASVIMEEFEAYMPALAKMARELQSSSFSAAQLRVFYRECVKESIDFGIMEHSRRVAVVCGTFRWDDIGSWESMLRIHQPDAQGTVHHGTHIFQSQCQNSIIVNESGRPVAVCGVQDCVVVATADAVLVVPRSELPRLKNYLAEMKKSGTLPPRLF